MMVDGRSRSDDALHLAFRSSGTVGQGDAVAARLPAWGKVHTEEWRR